MFEDFPMKIDDAVESMQIFSSSGMHSLPSIHIQFLRIAFNSGNVPTQGVYNTRGHYMRLEREKL